MPDKTRPLPDGAYTKADLERAMWPIAWNGEPDREFEAALRKLCREGIEAIDSTPNAVAVSVVDGEIAIVEVDEGDDEGEAEAECERCGCKIAGEHWSDPACNDTGEGVCLCASCAALGGGDQ